MLKKLKDFREQAMRELPRPSETTGPYKCPYCERRISLNPVTMSQCPYCEWRPMQREPEHVFVRNVPLGPGTVW